MIWFLLIEKTFLVVEEYTEEKIEQMKIVGIDYFTSGEHIFQQKGTEDFIDNVPVIRPANYPEGTAGEGYKIIETGKNGRVLLINLNGD